MNAVKTSDIESEVAVKLETTEARYRGLCRRRCEGSQRRVTACASLKTWPRAFEDPKHSELIIPFRRVLRTVQVRRKFCGEQ